MQSPMPSLFRLRFAFALSAVLAIYGWAGQRDYEDARALECAASGPSPGLAYDPIADRCEPRQPGEASAPLPAHLPTKSKGL